VCLAKECCDTSSSTFVKKGSEKSTDATSSSSEDRIQIKKLNNKIIVALENVKSERAAHKETVVGFSVTLSVFVLVFVVYCCVRRQSNVHQQSHDTHVTQLLGREA
jgi:hypothetical protein